jgi:hypothetical protein
VSTWVYQRFIGGSCSVSSAQYFLCLLTSPPVLRSWVLVVHFILLCVFTFLAPCYDVRFDFRSSLLPVVCRRADLCHICYICLFVYKGVQHVLTIWVTRLVSYKRQELITLREHLGWPLIVGVVRVAHLFSCLCCVVFLCFVCLRPVCCVPKVAYISGLSGLDCHIRVSLTYIIVFVLI